MAYRQGNPLVKLVILAVVVWAGWRYGLPWVKQQGFLGTSKTTVTDTPNAACVSAVDDAVAVWSNGIVRFMNPPIEPAVWSDFRSDVDRKIEQASSACNCISESCGLGTQISRDLRRLLSEMDAAVRSGGPPPGDLVQSQEAIDLKIEQAWKLVDAGK